MACRKSAPFTEPSMPKVTQETYRAHDELLDGLADRVADNLHILGDVDRNWQPTDFLPDLTAEDWRDQLDEFRQQALTVDDETLVVLVGDMVTEEALPSYSIALNRIAKDHTGDSDAPWARWLRGWTAEENRHGDLLNAYLRLAGRVDMRSVERTVQHLLNSGFNPRTDASPYDALVYTSFQERATKVSHRNVGRLAKKHGDNHLATICARIAGDESRHELFYTRMMDAVLDEDPDGGMLAIRRMIRGLIAMPGKHMCDGKTPDLFDRFSVVAQRSGVYTVRDYADILAHLVDTWDLANRPVTGKAARAQQDMCAQPDRYRNLADAAEQRLAAEPSHPFPWIHDRLA